MDTLTVTLKRLLSDLPGLQLAFLFGSHASGTARPDSDIDLAVLLDLPLTPELKQSLTESVAAELGCPVDIIDLFEAPEPITGEVLKGQRLAGDDMAYARLLTRHVMNVADFLPLRQRILDERRRAWID
jgi:predicted nucleotidyltransferase